MPPPKYTPIQRNRAAFYGERLPAYEFPVPIGQGGTAFGGYISPDLAAQSAMEMDDFYSRQDDSRTKQEENLTRRLQSRSRNQIFPHSTQAEIAAQRARAAQAAANERLSPFIEDATREQALTNVDQEQATRRALPGVEELAAEERQTRMDTVKSGEDRIKGIDPLAYDFHYRQLSDPKIPPRERQRLARNAALRLQNDAPFVAAIEDEAIESGDPEFRKKYLQDDLDEETGARFTRIKKGVDIGEVNALLRKRAYTKEQKARDEMELKQAREERIANAAYDNNRLVALKEAKATTSIVAKDPNADPAVRKAALDELQQIDAAIKELALKPTARPERTPAGKRADTAVPAPVSDPAQKPLTKPVQSRWSK